MTSAFNQIPQNIVEQAIAWHLQMNTAEAKASERVAFKVWLNQDTLHSDAYQRVEDMFQPFEQVDAKAAKRSIDIVLKAERKLSTRKNLSGIALSLTLLIATAIGWQMPVTKVMLADNKTAVGEIKTIALSDNSRIVLNTNTALDVDFNGEQRIIKLYKGEVFVEVAKDANRPFLVETEHGSARALGTQFVVNVEPDSTAVGVIESKVEACNTPAYINLKTLSKGQKHCVTLHPNQRINISQQSLGKVHAVDASEMSGWISGNVIYDNKPLPIVLNDLQRYSTEKLVFSEAALQHIQVSGVLPINNIPHAISILGAQFNLQIEVASDRKITINPID